MKSSGYIKKTIRLMLCVGILFNFQFSTFNSAHAQSPLSDSAAAYVLTCGPGNDFYTTFGHSAIRICDPARGIDLVYNYGTFDFDTPHFYWKFMRGQLDYQLGRTSFGHFMAEYASEGRFVTQQRLHFDARQTANLYLLLEQNYLPEYRYYRYDFFRDNCATRVRDMVAMAIGKGDTVLGSDWQAEPRSYRRLVSDNLRGTLEWWRLGIDMLFGLPADHRATDMERMFLPLEMRDIYAATLWRGDCGNANIAAPSEQLLPETRQPLAASFPPVVAFALLLVLVAVMTWKGWRRPWMDRVLFVLAGLVGLFLVFMWVGTDHYCTQWNLNILWANPLLILVAIRLERSPRWSLWLLDACFAAAAVWVLWCGLAPAILLLILTLALRTSVHLFRR